MGKAENKKRLLDFLDQKVFDPILSKSEDEFDTEGKRKKFEDVKKSTEEEKQRFHNYETAEDIKENFQRDLNSEPAKKVQSKLRSLDLPHLPEFKEEFFRLCEQLGVK